MQGLVFESTETVTAEQFAALVADWERRGGRNHCELLNGRVVMNPPAGYPHGRIGSNIQRIFGGFVHDANLGHLFDSTQGFELPSGDTVEPDHSFVSIARWSAAPLPEEGKFLRVVPDLIVEVLSPKTAAHDRGEKKAIYERNGVREYWLIDSRSREITIFQLVGDRFDRGMVHPAGDSCASHVLQGLSVKMSDLLPE